MIETAKRLEAFHGPAGPKVMVQTLIEEKNEVWRKPPATQWSAEKGGDERKAVFRVNVPARSSYRKASRASVQLKIGDGSLKVQSVKQNLLEYAVQWVMAFGPAIRAEVGSSSGSTEIAAFLSGQ